LILRWRDSEVLKGRLLAVEARTAHDRFGLTHKGIVRESRTIGKAIRAAAAARCEKLLIVFWRASSWTSQFSGGAESLSWAKPEDSLTGAVLFTRDPPPARENAHLEVNHRQYKLGTVRASVIFSMIAANSVYW